MPIKPSGEHTRTRTRTKSLSRKRGQNLEELVKAGVERFMLKESTIYDFMKALRSTEQRANVTPHPLTRDVFSRIVKEAVLKKKRQTPRK